MSVPKVAWPQAIYSTAQVRDFDRSAIETLGIAGFELMQRAGRAALRFLQARWPDTETLLIYCGAGNNAGDGYVLAALADSQGLKVRVIAVVDPAALSGDAARAAAMAAGAGVEVAPFREAAGSSEPRADVVVDALLGTGLARDVEGEMAAAVQRINAAPSRVLALDVPTGLDSDTGEVRGVAVEADATITFVGLKTGLFLGEAPALRGELGFSFLDLPADVYRGTAPSMRRIDASDPLAILKPRSRMSHKGLNGRVLVIGGAAGMPGAARLAAEAALRVGAGLVHAAVAPESVAPVMAGRPEIMCLGVSEPDDLEALCAAADVIVIGPGLGRTARAERLVRVALDTDKPLVVDADALAFLAGHPTRRGNWVLTPHAGEAARLLGRPTGAVQAARDTAVKALVAAFGGIVVLKGACSLVAQSTDNEEASVAVCDYGNPGMASGGMGDVLSGVLGGLIAQFGLSARVVESAVLIHARAGDDAAWEGQRGLLASDLFPHLRRRVNPV